MSNADILYKVELLCLVNNLILRQIRNHTSEIRNLKLPVFPFYKLIGFVKVGHFHIGAIPQ
jgi:hypothetical protein